MLFVEVCVRFSPVRLYHIYVVSQLIFLLAVSPSLHLSIIVLIQSLQMIFSGSFFSGCEAFVNMGKTLSKIFGKKEMRILMLGLDAAGKTSKLKAV